MLRKTSFAMAVVLLLPGCDRAEQVDREVCGNGVVDQNEACDDQNREPNDGCSSECKVEAGWSCSGTPSNCELTCGNGGIDAGEECDDGGRLNDDGCNVACTVEQGWTCEEGQDGVSICLSVCGNGVLDVVATENCDDHNLISGDGCDISCRAENGWYCENPDGLDNPSVCSTRCGDWIVKGLEACDDGNLEDCQGDCSADCSQLITGCGDGFVCGAEVCDDGNNDSCDGVCNADCSQVAGCGDGVECAGEACDDGNTEDCNGPCSADCLQLLMGCGDGIPCAPEECDDGGLNSNSLPDACRLDCRLPWCGDRVCDGGETGGVCREDCREVIFSEDFEGAWLGDWVTGDNLSDMITGDGLDTWGKSNNRAHAGDYSCWCAEDGNQASTYDNNMQSWAIRPVDLSSTAGSEIWVSFWVLYEMADQNDYFTGMYSTDAGNTWDLLEGLFGDSSGWVQKTYQLVDADGVADFMIGLWFQSDGYNSGLPGAYLDDLVIYRTW